MAQRFLVIYYRAVSTDVRAAKLTEEVDWLEPVLGTEVGGIPLGVADEVDELDDAMICRQLPDPVLGGDEVGATRGTDDRHSCRKFAVGGSEALPVFSLFLEYEKYTPKTERMMAVEEFGRTSDVVVQFATNQTFKEGLYEALFIDDDVAIVL